MVGKSVGNYVLRREIGRGAMGAVYLAENPHIGRWVAVKLLKDGCTLEGKVLQRFRDEARCIQGMDREHIVEISDYGHLPEGAPYLIMEWLDGQSLGQRLRDPSPLALKDVLRIIGGIGKGVAAAHACGVIHRDLKPDNIFLVRRPGDPYFPKVLDFGIAKVPSEKEVGEGTAPHLVMGTAAYMSPEQCLGLSDQVDPRSDIYSLGVILYELVLRRRPFVASCAYGYLVAHTTTPPPPPRTLDPALPEWLDAAILRALEKDRAHRFQSVHEFLVALGIAGAPLTAAATAISYDRVQLDAPRQRPAAGYAARSPASAQPPSPAEWPLATPTSETLRAGAGQAIPKGLGKSAISAFVTGAALVLAVGAIVAAGVVVGSARRSAAGATSEGSAAIGVEQELQPATSQTKGASGRDESGALPSLPGSVPADVPPLQEENREPLLKAKVGPKKGQPAGQGKPAPPPPRADGGLASGWDGAPSEKELKDPWEGRAESAPPPAIPPEGPRAAIKALTEAAGGSGRSRLPIDERLPAPSGGADSEKGEASHEAEQ